MEDMQQKDKAKIVCKIEKQITKIDKRLIKEAKKVLRLSLSCNRTISFLQRKLKIGFNLALFIKEELEKQGYYNKIEQRIDMLNLLIQWADEKNIPILHRIDINTQDKDKCLVGNFIGIPRNIQELYNMEFMSLRGLGIDKVPKEFMVLKKLRFLDLSFNPIDEIEFIQKMKNLRYVVLDFNENRP